AAEMNQPVLRFYGWNQPAASFGYFQKIAEIERATPLRPLVRRPTGGGLVPHAADWTYSVVIPPGHAWYELRAAESYEQMHRWIQSAFAQLGIETELASSARHEVPGQCFAGHEKSDVLWFGKKIAGAAQRRTRTGLLIQGSIQPQPISLARVDWQTAMCKSAEKNFNMEWTPLQVEGVLADTTERLRACKYSQNSFNKHR